MRLIAIGGEPAVGKTTIVMKLKGPEYKYFTYGLVRGYYNGNRYIIGIYQGHTFAGTDRLSMAVQPEFIRFLDYVNKKDPSSVVLFEGDRLFNASLFDTCKGYDTKIVIIKTSEEINAYRHRLRGDVQTEQFLKAKRTKVEKIKNAFAHNVFTNNTDAQQQVIIDYLKELMR